MDFSSLFDQRAGGALLKAQTAAFTGLIVLEKMNVFNFRSLRAPLSIIGYFTNRWLLIAWVSTLGLQVCAVYIPFLQRALHTTSLALEDWVLISIIALPVFIIPELYKLIRWQSRRSKREVREA